MEALLQPPAGGQQPPPATTQRCKTFSQFYSDEALDPCKRQYARIMHRFDPAHPNVIQGNILLDQALGSGYVPQAYLCCASSRRGTRIYCVHLPSRFAGALDGHVTPWDNNLYAFLGEVNQGIATIVTFPPNAFNVVERVPARTTENILQNLANVINGHDVLPPVAQNAQNEAQVIDTTTRYLMYLPARYVPLLLDSRGYTIKQVWDTLYPALVANQDELNCEPLLNWLRVASSGVLIPNPQGQNVLGPPCISLTLLSPPADADLIAHRNSILYQVLPGLKEPSVGLEAALSQMAVALMAQTNDNRVARDQREAEAHEPKLPSAKFTVTLPVLMEYLDIQDERNLPLLWHQWANCSKRQEFQVLKEVLDTYARGAEAFSPTVPIISAKLVQDLLGFVFVGDSADDIKTGLHPFVITDGSAEHRQANLEVSRLYGLLNNSDVGIMLADLEALKAKEVRSVPLTYWELEKSLGMFGNLLGVVLGSQHVLTTAFRQFWTLLRSGLRDELQFIIEYKGHVKPTHILRSIQLTCYAWFTHKRAQLQPPTPDFVCIARNITLQVYVLPHLPPTLYHLAYPKQPKSPGLASFPGSATVATASSSMGATTTVGTVVSGLTANTNTTRNTTRGTFQLNSSPDTFLQQLLPPNTRLKDIMGNDAPPLTDDGQTICLAFHLRNGCWSNCKRLQNHGKPLTTSEKQRLADYLTTQLSKRTLPAAQPAGSGTAFPP